MSKVAVDRWSAVVTRKTATLHGSKRHATTRNENLLHCLDNICKPNFAKHSSRYIL